MSWERRLRGIMLAGGTVALGACALTGSGCSSQQSGGSEGVCCNANPDPCCPSTNCGASKTDECRVEEACQADGGMYEVIGGTCSYATTDARADDGSAPDGR